MYWRFRLSYSTLLAMVAVPIVRSTHAGHVHPQFDGVGKGRLEAALNGCPDLVGQPVGQLERDQDLVVFDQRDAPASVCWRLGEYRGEAPARTHQRTKADNRQETCKNGPHHAVSATNVAHRGDPVVTLLVPNAMIQQGFSPSTQCESSASSSVR